MQKLTTEQLNRLSPEEFKKAGKIPVVLVLDNIRSMHNIGSAFRTADAFLIEKIYLCGVSARPPHKEIEKTALGATQTVEWDYMPNTLDAVKKLKENGYGIYAVEQAKNSIILGKQKAFAEDKLALVFGNEVYGVDQVVIDACDHVVEIPQYGTKHSLNVSVSIGILLWEIIRTLNK
jgi:23S rRNA (guanosine2251-2'-O)-methyltransferase